MKLRIRGNSIRLRLTKTEVETLAQNKAVDETTDFGNGQAFAYSILPSDISENLKANFQNGKIEIMLSKDVAKNWAESEEVGISANQNQLNILIEKDFTCLKPRAGEEDTDTFPHPKEAEVC